MSKWSLEYLDKHLLDDPSNPPDSEFAIGACAKADHIYPEMLRKYVRPCEAHSTPRNTHTHTHTRACPAPLPSSLD